MQERDTGELSEQLDERAGEIQDYVERNSPRPSVDGDVVGRILDEAPPAEAEEEIEKMVGGFRSGAGAATGRRNEPAAGEPPIDDVTPES